MHRVLALVALTVGLLAAAEARAAVVPVDVSVPAGAAETVLASFETPTGTVTSEVVVGRFLIDYPTPASATDDIIVQVQTHDAVGTNFPPTVAAQLGVPSSGGIDHVVSGDTVATLFLTEVTTIATAATHRIVEARVIFTPDYTFAAGPHSWNLRVLGVSGTAVRYTGFFEDDSTDLAAARAAVTQPQVSVSPPTLAFGDTQINLDLSQTPVEDFSWSNLGTDAFNPTGGLAPSGGGPYSLFSTPVLTTLNPGDSSPTVQIQFRPTQKGSGGPNQETITISGAAASSGAPLSTPIQLEGNGVSLSSILLLDVSGSMNRHVDSGAHEGGEQEHRLWAAKQAGLQLFDAFEELTSGEGAFGVYTFPDPDRPAYSGDPPTASAEVPLNEASLISGPVTVALGPQGTGGLRAISGTPMHEGLVLAIGALPNGNGTDDRPSTLLLSDGEHNIPRVDDQPLTAISAYNAKAARIFSVPFGTPGQGEVNHLMLQTLANNTDGVVLPADPADPGTIKKAFRGALREWLGLRDDADPESTIGASEAKTHEVCLDDQAYQAVFTVDWYEQRDDAISFTLETPLGATLTPSSPDLSFSANRSYAMYVVYGRHIRGGNGAGLWKLNLRGGGGLPGALGYQYSVMTQAVNPPQPSLQLLPGFLAEGLRLLEFYAGEPWMVELPVDPELKARIEGSETGLRARIDAPSSSVGTFLATSEVEREWVFQGQARRAAAAAGQREGEPLSIAARKAEALARYADLRFEDQRTQQEIRFQDEGRDGDRVANDRVYTALLPPSRFDGLYQVSVLLELAQTRRGCTNIDTAIGVYVPIHMASAVDPANVRWVDVVEDLFFDPSIFEALELGSPPASGHVRRAAVFTAKDELGNHLGPGQTSQIAFAAENARLVGPVVDNWDGTYVQVVEYERGADPTVTVSAGGFTSEALSPEPPRAWVMWFLVLLVVLVLAYFVLRFLRSSP